MATSASSLLRVASRTFQNSSRGLTTGDGHIVRICSGGSHATIGDKFIRSHELFRHTTIASYSSQPTAQQTMIKKGEHKRSYHSGKGKKKNDDDSDIDIDRSKFTHEVKVSMPDMGDGEDDDDALCVVDRWYKKEGDIIKREEVICDIRTKIFTFGMMADDDYDSIMGKILVPEESDPVKPGTAICIILNDGGETETKEDDE